MRVFEPPLDKCAVLRWSTSGLKLLNVSITGTRRGVLHPLVVKSIRIRRAESLVKCSRQKGQAGVRRGEVFSTMVVQQLAHRTWPGRKRSDFFFQENFFYEKKTYHKELNVGGGGVHIPPRRRRKRTRGKE
jgi:hypothetical protein